MIKTKFVYCNISISELKELGYKQIPGYGDYFVSRGGEFYSTKSRKLMPLKIFKEKTGYGRIALTENGIKKTFSAHILVAKTWIPNLRKLPTVNHKDGNKLNNTVDNLEWFSYKDQVEHARDTGLVKNLYVRSVCQATMDGKLIETYTSMTIAQKKTGIPVGRISRVCSGKERSAGGFLWHYKENFKGQTVREICRTKYILQHDLDGNFIARWKSAKEAADAMGVKFQAIANTCRGTQQTCKGYKFTYEILEKEDPFAAYKDWKCLDRFPKYLISPEGKVFSKITNRILDPEPRQGGYVRLKLTDKDGTGINMYIHQLMGITYIPNPDDYPIVNHLDGKPSNNNVKNLEWTDRSGNGIHAYETGLNKNIRPVIQLSLDGKEIARFPSISKAASTVGVGNTTMRRALSDKNKISAGSKWKYA